MTQISTVHAFCADLLREFAFDLDIPADFRMLEQTEAAASNGGAEEKAKSFGTLFYGLLIVTVLLALLFVWAAMKRGVFSRN